MRRSFSFLLAATCSLSAIANSGHAESLKGFTEQFKTTQFISDNAEALKFRLALLDNASPGAQVRVATFTYDYGKATQALAAHMCSAVSRGVKVEMIVDSKSGEILGQDNPYNSTDDGKKTEQAYQDLANCGVQIYIHNFTTDFVTISLLGKRIPNIFGNQVQSGSSVNPLSLLSRLKALRARLVQVIQPTLQKNRLSVDPGNVLANVQDLALNLAQFIPEAGNGYKASEDNGTGSPTVDPLESEISTLSSDYRAILNDAFWTQFDSKNPKQSIAKMKSINNAIIHALETDPELKDVRDKLRVFNRLNHRKLFMVQEPNGESCVIIGGRNLGDLYLTNGTLANGTGTYRDGDIFFCKQQSPTSAQFFTEANASLDQLKTDPTDSVMKATGHVVVKLVKAIRKIVGAKVASISSTDLKADSLGEIKNPMLLTSSWNPGSDGVRMAMIEAILRERKELYIETAYAEFNSSLREALEIAMKKNGVKVHIVTNSLFISDAASQLIRLWMAKWNYEMKTKYPNLFEIDYAPLSAGHMIHFKGAGFRCQSGFGGTFYRQYIVGSHNFHPRSGYSDKEHAIEWRELLEGKDVSACVEPASDLITLRMDYYKAQRALNHGPVLRKYETLLEELQEVAGRYNDLQNANVARAIERTMYINDNLVLPERLGWIEDLLDASGLRDLIGILL